MNNKEENIRFFVITDDSFTSQDKSDITDVILTYNRKNIVEFIVISDDLIQDILKFEDGWYTRQTFYRLFVSELLPKDVHRVIYLDGDTLVRGDLGELWNIDITDYALAATNDAQEAKPEQFNRLQYPMYAGYFNAGVLLINLDYWRKVNAIKLFQDFIKYHSDRIVLNDQDILNFIFWNQKISFPMKFNVQADYLFQVKYLCLDYWGNKEELDEARVNPIVIHYSGDRPWEEKSCHPYRAEYYKYQKMTKWADSPLKPARITFKARLINAFRPLGQKMGVCHVIPDYYDRTLKLRK